MGGQRLYIQIFNYLIDLTMCTRWSSLEAVGLVGESSVDLSRESSNETEDQLEDFTDT